MSGLVNVAVHSSVFPENVERDLLQCLRARRVDPKFHYVSYKQARKWLALHEAFSPARTEASCLSAYDLSYDAAARELKTAKVSLIGLGCGGGQKEARLLTRWTGQGGVASYTPCDISLSLVLTSLTTAQTAVPGLKCSPVVCDFGRATDLPQLFEDDGNVRLYTFFGMAPNFEPELIFPRLAALIRPGDLMLLSANLAPGADYAEGVQRVLPGYDNPQTRDWLFTFLGDLGVEDDDGSILFSVEENESGLKRIVADYQFCGRRVISVHGEQFKFMEGDNIRLFFSYRYSAARIKELLASYNLSTMEEFTAESGEEGIFVCRRNDL